MTLWRKLVLSTQTCTFTITTSLYTNLFTTTTKTIARPKLIHRPVRFTTNGVQQKQSVRPPGRILFAEPVGLDCTARQGRHKLPAGLSWSSKQGKAAESPVRLWKSRCISTGADVQNVLFLGLSEICPSSVPTSHRLCSTGKWRLKSLILWSKQDLSTVNCSFTIYYQVVYIL